MTERLTIIKGRRPVNPHEPQNEARMLRNSLEALLKQEGAVAESGQTGLQVDPRIGKYRERIKHQRGG